MLVPVQSVEANGEPDPCGLSVLLEVAGIPHQINAVDFHYGRINKHVMLPRLRKSQNGFLTCRPPMSVVADSSTHGPRILARLGVPHLISGICFDDRRSIRS